MTGTKVKSTVNADLVTERSRASFRPEKITNLIDGSSDLTATRRKIEDIIRLDPTGVFDNSSNAYLHRSERHVRALAKHVRILELLPSMVNTERKSLRQEDEIVMSHEWYAVLCAIADDLPTSLHWVMFVPNIYSLCDEEQKAEWLPKVRDWKMVGCYAQTELGHGSNVRALETTATFLGENDGGESGGSFIINSPTLTSTKFWPGSLGKTANHAMVIARLIDGEKVDRGMHNFLVPLRSMEDHSHLPGVITGDIGPKIGYNNMDNGFARFDHVKIPRRNMAMKFSIVDENGKYIKKSLSDATSKVAYITMMRVRASIIFEANVNLAKACTIVIRYSAVRRQGFDDSKGESGKEVQILDYTQQQHRLFPLLAASYGFYFAGRNMLNHLDATDKELNKKDISLTKTDMADLHASSSCLKSFCTMIAADGIEECRKACGGHGFLQCSGLPELLGAYLQSPTVEGDNHMLPQQVVRVLLKLVQAIVGGDDLDEYKNCRSKYLIKPMQNIMQGKCHCHAKNEEEMMDLETLTKAFEHRAARLLLEVAQMVQEKSAKTTFQKAWNECLIQMARVSKAHALSLVVQSFTSGIADGRREGVIGLPEATVLTDLAKLFALYWTERDVGDFLEDGYLSKKQSRWVRNGVLRMLHIIRPNAVALVDARDFSDFRLKSDLGRYDGDVYPAIMASAMKDPLNANAVGPGYEHLRKMYVEGAGVVGTASRL